MVGQARKPYKHGHRLQVGARELQLTSTELRLWQSLSSQPGRAFSRSELLHLVTPDAIVIEWTIDVHIRALRKKLGEAAASIRTVRGEGYVYVPPQEEGLEIELGAETR